MALEISKTKEENSHLERISEEVAQLKEVLMDCISRMEGIFDEVRVLAVAESLNVEETKESFEATVGALEVQLQEKEEIIGKESLALKELEGGLNRKILNLENLVKEKEKLLEVREAEVQELRSKSEILEAGIINLREEDEVSLGEEEGNRSLEAEVATELERLRDEIHERDIILKAKEMEIKMVKQSMEERIKELERIIKRQAAQKKNARLVTLIGTIEKRN